MGKFAAAAIATVALVAAIPAFASALGPAPAAPSVTRASIKITGPYHFNSSSPSSQSMCGIHHGGVMISYLYFGKASLQIGLNGPFMGRDGTTDLAKRGTGVGISFLTTGPFRDWSIVPRHGHSFFTLSDNRTSVSLKATMYPRNRQGHLILTKKPIHVVASFNCLPVPTS